MSIIKYSSVLFKNSKKKGKLVPNKKGEYTFCVGALDIMSTRGDRYTLEGAEQLFKKSSMLMKRIKAGGLYAENGHPVRVPGQTDEEYLGRIHTIEEARICGFISDLWLDRKALANEGDGDSVAIMAKIKPFGELGDVLAQSIANEKQNVCFSVRGFTNDTRRGGVTHRALTNIITFDFVTMPGIPVANRSNSGSLESLEEWDFDTESLSYDMMGACGRTEEYVSAVESGSLLEETVKLYTQEKIVAKGSLFKF